MYGYQYNEVPVYFNGGPIFNAGGVPVAEAPAAAGGRGGGRGSALSQNTVPNARLLDLARWDPAHTGTPYAETQLKTDSLFDAGGGGRGGRGGGGAPGAAATPPAANGAAGAATPPAAAPAGNGRGGRGGGSGVGQALPGVTVDPNSKARVIMQFPAKASDMLLSGTLDGGDGLAGRAQLIDESVGKGHIVMFAFRPYWRWQTQGTFAMGFNAIVNWNHLDAGK